MKKHLHTFEEFIGDEETKNLRKQAIDQEKKDGDQISVDLDMNNPETELGDEDDIEGDI
jgi:hypothetical protein